MKFEIEIIYTIEAENNDILSDCIRYHINSSDSDNITSIVVNPKVNE